VKPRIDPARACPSCRYIHAATDAIAVNNCQHDWMDRDGWRECFLCGAQEDVEEQA
jgi:hypothetical protein